MATRIGEITGAVVKQIRPTQQPEPEDRSIEAWCAMKRREALADTVSWLERVGVGRRLREIAIDIDLIPAQCAHWIANYRNGAGMILAGPVGTGKTLAAVHCLRAVYADGERHDPEAELWEWRPVSACYVKARDLYRAVFERDTATIERARNAQVLVIDEWGGAYESPWPLMEMDGIVDDRWEERRATIITTNSDVDTLRATAPRAHDRLCDEPGPGLVVVDRKSMRGEVVGGLL